MMNRREGLAWLGLAGLSIFTKPNLLASALGHKDATGTAGGWKKFSGNPVLGGQYGTCFDICVLRENNTFRMWLSWRPKKAIAMSDSTDGIHWSAPRIVLPPSPDSDWEFEVNRPVVVHRDDGYHMWYTGQTWNKQSAKDGNQDGHSAIGYAISKDGITWENREKVIAADLPWEGVALMSPHVLWDEQRKQWRIWYSGGEQYEPNAIGHATSTDGVHWTKDANNPIFRADPQHEWEKERVAGCQVIQDSGWYYIFYIGYRDIDHAQIGLARSRDGLTNWERLPANPIIRAAGKGFDADACYKPYALFADGKWMLWYNGRTVHLEQIGLATRTGRDLGFHKPR
jgi:predicted GH43/DUF377 family glycosyl hydrolase